MHELYELKEKLLKELEEYGAKGEMTTGSLDVVDKLAHTVKNLCKIIEAYEEEEYSQRGGSYEGSYARNRGYSREGSYARGGGSYAREGGSYARGRGGRSYAMNRYSGERGYSRDNLADKMRELMEDAPDDRTRQEIQRLVEKLENA